MIQKILSIDIETFSPVRLTDSGVYPYAAHPEFTVLLMGYAIDDDPVQLVDCARGEKIPAEILAMLVDPAVLKTAYNASFERVCLNAFLKLELPIEQWECTMIRAAMCGLPMGLAKVAEVMQLDVQKDTAGGALIRYFSLPATKRPRNLPHHDAQKWEMFRRYCAKDVEVERSIRNGLPEFDTLAPKAERDLWILDQVINDTGVMIDVEMVRNAIKMDEVYRAELEAEASELTSLDNPNSIAQLKDWISEETGEDVDSLTKDSIQEMLKNTSSEEVTRVLQIRQEMAKTSVKKYYAMLDAVGDDCRIRGLLQFYGASRTGRWAGRLVQIQNLPQNHLKDLDLARRIVAEGNLDDLTLLFGNVPDTLSQLIRTAFVPSPGHTFVVADFSAIEARVIAWLADEQWRLDVFRTHGKIYEASASQMFQVPIESVTKGSVLRQKGKIAELALGYQGGVGALEKMGAAKMGLKAEELPGLVAAWRSANPKIVHLWAAVDQAARYAIEEGGRVPLKHGVHFEMRESTLYIELPSGRHLAYMRARLGTGKYADTSIQYDGLNQTTKQWTTMDTYGGKLTENIVQAIARDCLAYAMLALTRWGYKIVMHIHDEVVMEVPVDDQQGDLEVACEVMGMPIPWAPGLPLRADGYITPYYRKD